jgi:hypothetical protein
MKAEALYFTGVALFFAVTSAIYIGWSGGEPAGGAALLVSFLMSSLIAFFLWAQYRKRGSRPEDRRDGKIVERAGRLDFFPPHSIWPVVSALGFTLLALGVVYGLWLFLIGFSVVSYGVFRFVFQYPTRGE